MRAIQVSIEMDSDLKIKLETLKKHYKTQSNEKLLRILVNEKAQLIANSMEAITDATQ